MTVLGKTMQALDAPRKLVFNTVLDPLIPGDFDNLSQVADEYIGDQGIAGIIGNLLGFAGDVVTDPASWVGAPTGPLGRTGSKALIEEIVTKAAAKKAGVETVGLAEKLGDGLIGELYSAVRGNTPVIRAGGKLARPKILGEIRRDVIPILRREGLDDAAKQVEDLFGIGFRAPFGGKRWKPFIKSTAEEGIGSKVGKASLGFGQKVMEAPGVVPLRRHLGEGFRDLSAGEFGAVMRDAKKGATGALARSELHKALSDRYAPLRELEQGGLDFSEIHKVLESGQVPEGMSPEVLRLWDEVTNYARGKGIEAGVLSENAPTRYFPRRIRQEILHQVRGDKPTEGTLIGVGRRVPSWLKEREFATVDAAEKEYRSAAAARGISLNPDEPIFERGLPALKGYIDEVAHEIPMRKTLTELEKLGFPVGAAKPIPNMRPGKGLARKQRVLGDLIQTQEARGKRVEDFADLKAQGRTTSFGTAKPVRDSVQKTMALIERGEARVKQLTDEVEAGLRQAERVTPPVQVSASEAQKLGWIQVQGTTMGSVNGTWMPKDVAEDFMTAYSAKRVSAMMHYLGNWMNSVRFWRVANPITMFNNVTGGILNNWMGRVGPKAMLSAREFWSGGFSPETLERLAAAGLSPEDIQNVILLMREDRVLNGGLSELFETTLEGDSKRLWGKGPEFKMHPRQQQARTLGGNIEAGTQTANKHIERQLRGAAFIQGLEDTGSISAAREKVIRLHGDYSDLTGDEQFIRNYVFPFYKWIRFNTATQLETIISDPGAFMRIARMPGIWQEGQSREEVEDWNLLTAYNQDDILFGGGDKPVSRIGLSMPQFDPFQSVLSGEAFQGIYPVEVINALQNFNGGLGFKQDDLVPAEGLLEQGLGILGRQKNDYGDAQIPGMLRLLLGASPLGRFAGISRRAETAPGGADALGWMRGILPIPPTPVTTPEQKHNAILGKFFNEQDQQRQDRKRPARYR